MTSLQHSGAAAAKSAALRSFEAQWLKREAAPLADPLAALRESAMERFVRLGLPTTRDESWRYTNLRRLAAQSFVDAQRAPDGALRPSGAFRLTDALDRAVTVLMVNGYPVLPADMTNDSIEIISLKELSRTDPALLARYLSPLTDAEEARWGLLNTALFVDGLYLKIKSQAAAPLVILHIATADRPDTVAYPRVIIEGCAGSKATIIEHHVQQGDEAPLFNSATHMALRKGAELEHYRLFATGAGAAHIDSLSICQERDSRCRQFTVALGGGLVRASLDARLTEANASLESFALLVGHGERHVDCVNIVRHSAADTRSRQTARAIASGTSRVIFNSKVIVDAGAVRADSQQSCRGLLLSPTAEIDSRPQLEIHADEVKCAHGATTGRLDPDMLFYMLSRGLDRDTAQSLLVYAFLADVLTGMSVASARGAIESALIDQLPDSQVLQRFR
jgi:Fe-S cluster assembly protein SufD